MACEGLLSLRITSDADGSATPISPQGIGSDGSR